MLTLIVDTREQQQLQFRGEAFDSVKHQALPYGDYGAELGGKLLPIVFERKGLGDLFGTMTSGYKRFKAEMGRAKDAGAVLVLLVEGTLADVEGGYEHSSFSGDSMLKKLAMLRVRYDLEWHCLERREMARYIEEIFRAVERNWRKSGRTRQDKGSVQAGQGSQVKDQ